MEHITRTEDIRNITVPETPSVLIGQKKRDLESVAREICDNRSAFSVVFIHADTGGRKLAEGLPQRADAYCQAALDLCGWPQERCVLITPSHETESWLMADGKAVLDALGASGECSDYGLPEHGSEAERIGDPKAKLTEVTQLIAGRRATRGVQYLFPAIAQGQSIRSLQGCSSFRVFERNLRNALINLGCIPRA